MAPSFICLGAVFWESLFQVERIPGHGTKLLPEAGRQLASGMAPCAAVTLVRLGGQAALWTRTGDDPVGQSIARDLAQAELDVTDIQQRPGLATAFSSVLVDAQGERLVVPCFDVRLYAGADGLPLHKVRAARAVLADMRWPDGAQALLQQARTDGVPSVLDADVAPQPDLQRLMPLADHVLLSEDALRLLRPDAVPRQALLELARDLPHAQVLGVTLGAQGALLLDCAQGVPLHIPSFPITPRDTLNAGDVWHGTYAWALGQGMGLEERAHLANAAAALKCLRPWGRLGIPTLDEVRAFILLNRDRLVADEIKGASPSPTYRPD